MAPNFASLARRSMVSVVLNELAGSAHPVGKPLDIDDGRGWRADWLRWTCADAQTRFAFST